MTKSAKHKKAAAADFKKTKAKLGVKQAASNATSTAFKARSIALPQQSVNVDRSGAFVTKRNLTFDECIAHTRHYSAGVRKDGLIGLRELLVSYPSLVLSTPSSLLAALAPLISDADAGVRKALHSFEAWYLTQLPKPLLLPHVGTHLLYTTSAMSHIYPDVRIDALQTLDTLLSAAPEAVVQGWDASEGAGARVLACYRNLLGLGAGTSGTAIRSTVASDLGVAAKLRLLSSLRRFVDAGVAGDEQMQSQQLDNEDGKQRCPTWHQAPAFANTSAFDAFVASFQLPDSVRLQQGELPPLADAALARPPGSAWGNSEMHAAMAEAVDHSAAHATTSPRLALFQALAPLLLSSFLDSAPTAFSPSATAPAPNGTLDTHAALICALAALCVSLWRGTRSAPAQARNALGGLLGKMSAYFPFAAGRPHAQLDALDRAYAELSALHSLSVPLGAEKAADQARLARVEMYVRALLRREQGGGTENATPSYAWWEVTPGSAAPATRIGGGVALTAQAYAGLLPSIWLLLNRARKADEEPADALLVDMLEHWREAKGDVKRLATEALARLVSIHTLPAYTARWRAPLTPTVNWIAMLPRYLWELGTKDTGTTYVVLELLAGMACRAPSFSSAAGDVGEEHLRNLQASLAPFFYIAPRPGMSKAIKGPYARLPTQVQDKAKGLLFFLPRPLCGELESAARAVGIELL